VPGASGGDDGGEVARYGGGTLLARVTGAPGTEYAGTAVTLVDLDGDAAIDLVAGVQDDARAGAAWAFAGPVAGTLGAADAAWTWAGGAGGVAGVGSLLAPGEGPDAAGRRGFLLGGVEDGSTVVWIVGGR
jgi:hypothetical protein